MDLIYWRLLFDLALVILIWMVQLIIYPGFLHYQSSDLRQWHQKYSSRISILVVPLMLGQLSIAFYQLIRAFNLYSVSSAMMILGIWVITFIYFAPAHQKISQGKADTTLLRQLVQINWFRTILWNMVFGSSLLITLPY